MVTALLADRAGVRFKAHRSGSDVAEGRLAEVPVTLARPRSYMNLSGKPVAALAAFYKVPPDRLVVIHDELDVPFGTLRLKRSEERRVGKEGRSGRWRWCGKDK